MPLPEAIIDFRLYAVSIDASKDLMVSSGRSHRYRVGFDRSGSSEIIQ